MLPATSREGRDRARLRHGVVGRGWPSRRARRRHRQFAGAARDGAAAPARARSRLPAASTATPRRGPARCELRLRHLRVRRSLGGPVPLDSRSRASPSARRPARFLVNSELLVLCMPSEDDVAATERLLRPTFGLHRIDWPDGSPTSTSRTEWIRLLRRSGFEIEDLSSSAAGSRRDDALSVRHPRMGAAVAVRRGLGGAQGIAGLAAPSGSAWTLTPSRQPSTSSPRAARS